MLQPKPMVDLLIVALFFAQAIWVGLRQRKRASESLEEYFLAGRSLPGWQAGISMAATQFAADTPLLVTGLIATAGIFSLWRLWIYAVAFLLMGFLLSHSWRNAGVVTDAELSELRYSKRPALFLRGFKAIYFGTLINCIVLAMVMLAATRIAEPFLLWNQWLPGTLFSPIVTLVEFIGTPLTVHKDSPEIWQLSANNLISIVTILAVTAMYSTTGGLRSVVTTDVVQFFLMMVATFTYAMVAVATAGGWSSLSDKVRKLYSSSMAPFSGDQLLALTPAEAPDWTWGLITVLAFQWLIQMNSDGTGYLAQRSMACRTPRDARQAAVIFTFAQVLLRTLFWLPIGLSLLVVFPPSFTQGLSVAAREQTFVQGMLDLLPPGILGLMLTGMLAALASTVDTHLNWGASYWSRDLYGRIYCEVLKGKKADPRQLVWAARISNIALTVLALMVMIHLDSIQNAWQLSLVFGAALGIPLLLRWFWWRMNAWGEIFALMSGLLLGPYLIWFAPESLADSTRLLLVAATSTLACLLGVFLMGPESRECLQRFYLQTRPLGRWAPVSKGLPLPPGTLSDTHRLRTGLLGTLTSAISLFCLLVGLGSWIVRAPYPNWFPSLSSWVIANIALAMALVPIWWKILCDDRK